MPATPEAHAPDCGLRAQKHSGGSCGVEADGEIRPACKVTLRERDGKTERLVETVASAGRDIPFTILAFFPEHKMRDFRAPNTEEMLDAYGAASGAGLVNIRLGKIGVFAKTREEVDRVLRTTGRTA